MPVTGFSAASSHGCLKVVNSLPLKKVTASREGIYMSVNPYAQRGPSSLAVSIDKPVMIPSYSTSARPPRIRSEPSILSNAWNSISPLITIQLVQKCVIAFVAALVLSLMVKLAIPKFALPLAKNSADYLRGKTTNAFKTIQGQIRRLKDSIAKRKQISSPGIPMPFEGDDGWGKSSFRSRKFVGKSAYIQYDFDLPDSEYTLPLQLGQKLTLCSLDENNRVQKGDFYVSSPRANKGSFSLVAPLEDMEEQIGKSNAKFVAMLEKEVKIGDEIAIKPGPKSLEYRGQYLPVTDLVFMVYGAGVVPIVDQVKSVLPKSSSTSVRSVSVVWVNEDPSSFDLAFSQLEREFYKYSTKLEVSCCVEDVKSANTLAGFDDIEQSVPNFAPGTMAVISGPMYFASLAYDYFQSRQFPDDCICTLPP